MNFNILYLSIFMQLLGCCLPSAAQCPEVETVLKDIVKDITPKVISQDYNTYERVTCYTLGEMNEDDFILLGRGLEYSNLTKNESNNVEYNVLRMVNRQNGIACERIFIRKKQNNDTKIQTYNQFQRQRVANLLKAKQEQLALLKKQQGYLTTDILNILGDVLVAEIEAPAPFSNIISDVAQKLKDYGITQVSKFYEIDYEPSENETANLVRRIINPIDKYLAGFGIPTGKFLKYWAAIKLTPDGGMAIGNTVAKVRLYFMEKELQDEINHLQRRLEENPNDVPSNTYTGTTEGTHFKSNW